MRNYVYLLEGSDQGWLKFSILLSILFLSNFLFSESPFSINTWDWARDVDCEVFWTNQMDPDKNFFPDKNIFDS